MGIWGWCIYHTGEGWGIFVATLNEDLCEQEFEIKLTKYQLSK